MSYRASRNIVWIGAVAFALIASPGFGKDDPTLDELWVSAPAKPIAITKTLRDTPPARQWSPGIPFGSVNTRRVTNPDALTRPAPVFTPQRDPLVDRQIAVPKVFNRAFGTPDVNVEGQSFGNSFPPDTAGEIGSTHYIQMINNFGGTSVQAYDKASGAAVLGAPTPLSSLAPMGDPCNSSGAGDPVPLFDQLADRWVLTEFVDGMVGNHLCAYVSDGADPTTSTWMLYRFDLPLFPDYPKWAVWPDAYYIGTNESGVSPVYALDRAAMLAGTPATMIRRTTSQLPGFSFQILPPVDLDGLTVPPPGSPGIFIRHRDDEAHDAGTPGSDQLEIFEFTADFVTPANSTLVGPIVVTVAEFESDLCTLNGLECFPQPGTSVKLDPLREPMMHRPTFRNFGTHQSLIGNFVTDVDGGAADRGGVRWFELQRAAASTSGGWSVFQEGTVSAADGLSRWMGSIATDQAGNMALAYSSTGPNAGQFPSLRYTGRESGDPLGTMPQVETVIVAGGASQVDFTRWGDYSAMTIDPLDDCTFWFTSEYVPAGTMNLWTTQIASFTFDSCGGALFTDGFETGNTTAWSVTVP